MTREIKFRFVYERPKSGFGPYKPSDVKVKTKIFNLGEIPEESPFWKYCHLVARDQYTGLHDKNGKEIYEGDIVNSNSAKGRRPVVEKVEFDKDITGFTPFCQYDSDCGVYVEMDKVEVIGNIYENPELLEVKQ